MPHLVLMLKATCKGKILFPVSSVHICSHNCKFAQQANCKLHCRVSILKIMCPLLHDLMFVYFHHNKMCVSSLAR